MKAQMRGDTLKGTVCNTFILRSKERLFLWYQCVSCSFFQYFERKCRLASCAGRGVVDSIHWCFWEAVNGGEMRSGRLSIRQHGDGLRRHSSCLLVRMRHPNAIITSQNLFDQRCRYRIQRRSWLVKQQDGGLSWNGNCKWNALHFSTRQITPILMPQRFRNVPSAKNQNEPHLHILCADWYGIQQATSILLNVKVQKLVIEFNGGSFHDWRSLRDVENLSTRLAPFILNAIVKN